MNLRHTWIGLSLLFTLTPVAQASVKATIDTNYGQIKLVLFDKKAPITVQNFESYAKEGFYNGTIFHRVIDGFMIQGGGFTPDMQQKPTHAPIKNEADNGVPNWKYTIAMARTPDPNSATSQFFINTANNDFLNFKTKTIQGWGYAVFGKVTSGFDVVDKISKVKTTIRGPFQDVPEKPIIIEKVTIDQ